MAFCGNCGAALAQESGFCGACGKPIGTANPGPQGTAVTATVPAGATGLSTNVAGALAYVLGLITGLIFLVLEPYKNDRFVRFHAMQSILFCAACIVFSIAWTIVWGILFGVSAYLALIALPLRMLISLGIFVYWLFLMYRAYQGREYRIPLIGNIAAKQVA
jgi:uncharacterized membrane protein